MSDDQNSADFGLKLAQLTALHEQGVLSDEEFNSATKRMSDDQNSADFGLKLAQLTALHEQGVLSDEEFNSATKRMSDKKAATHPPPDEELNPATQRIIRVPSATQPPTVASSTVADNGPSFQKPKSAQDHSGARDTQPQGPEFTIEQAADAFHVSIPSIKYLQRNGEFPNARRLDDRTGSPWMIPVEDLIGAGLTPGKPSPPLAPVTERLSQWPKYWGLASGVFVGLAWYGGLYGVRDNLLSATFSGVLAGLCNWGFLWLVQKGARAVSGSSLL